MPKQRITVTKESDTGRNLGFHDNKTGENMSRAQFVKKIEQGDIKGYHVRKVNNVKTPVSNPNGRESDNLG